MDRLRSADYSLRSGSEAASALAELTGRVELSREGMPLSIKLPLHAGDDREATSSGPVALTRFVPMEMKRRGVEMRMVLEGDSFGWSDGPLRSRGLGLEQRQGGRIRSVASKCQ